MKYLTDLVSNNLIFELYRPKRGTQLLPNGKASVNILGVGDVGRTVLTGLKLIGGDVIDHIGIYDTDAQQCKRIELEMNQMDFPFEECQMPVVSALEKEHLFDCDLFLFCASKEKQTAQSALLESRNVLLAENLRLITQYGKMAKAQGFHGLFAIISEPADQLCPALLSCGINRTHIRAFGLGVMHTRALDIARNDAKFVDFLRDGRVFGPQGADLVVANSLSNYDLEISKELTRQTLKSHLKIRALGFRPYIAPSLTSGAISIIQMLRGQWHYSTIYLGTEKDGGFFGLKNKITPKGPLIEDTPIHDTLFEQIETAFNMCKL